MSRALPILPPGTLGRARRTAQSQWYAWWRRAPLAEDTVLWISFDGMGMLCHPRAIFDTILEDPRYSHLKHVWILARDTRHSDEVRAITEHPRVLSAAVGSPLYFRALATAKYLVNNSAFPEYFVKRRGQVYLNTWHGMPMKHIGYDLPNGRRSAANTVRNFLQADYLLSSGPAMTEALYERAYRLNNIYPGTILETGFPRMDVQFDGSVRDNLRRDLARHDVAMATERVALVAPTLRGGTPGDQTQAIGQLCGYLTTLREALGPRWTVLITLPPHTPREIWDTPALRGAVVPSAVNANRVLGAADLLVSESSSLIFDYLPRGRPAIFMAPDTEECEEASGFYRPTEEWPGPVVGDLGELAAAASRVAEGHDDLADARRAWLARFCPLEDGEASQRVIDVVFGARPDLTAERKLQPDGRTRLLLHVGGMRRNGITSSVLSLLRSIDHERVDVTCFLLDSSQTSRLQLAGEIDPRVRILLRSGGFSATRANYLRARAAYTGGFGDPAELPPAVQAVFTDEWARCFGSAQFDRVADFSAYGAMWGLILLAGPAPLHGIWLHNEMLADSQRIVNGRRPLHRRLHAVFGLYRRMDRLISVSPALRDVNRDQLARFAAPEKFFYARNSLDFERIDLLAATAAPEDEAAEAVMRWLAARRDCAVFVTAGRLSSEKNHERLIRAFAEVHRSHPNTALLILGDGVLRHDLEDLVRELDLGRSCLVAGFHPNPFQLMRQCQCFVLSSNHEGQPMVILEALHLGLQVITTRFSSVDSALPAGVGLVVEQDVHALAEGMRSHLEGGLGRVSFDSAAYNADALDEFYEALDIPEIKG